MSGVDRRVVITGIGLVTPLGNSLQSNWEAICSGRSGIGTITRFDASGFVSRIAGEVRDFEPTAYIEKKEVKKMDAFTQYAVAASQMAVDDSLLRVESVDRERIGVVIGVGMGGIATIEEGLALFEKDSLKRLSPFFIPRLIANMAPAQVAMRFGAQGVNMATTSACASGGHAVGEAARLIRMGYQDVMLCGGSEAGVTPLCVAGFAAMRALSTRNSEPSRASRPFDRERDGFVVGEGAGILVLEHLEMAQARGARVYAEVVGYGANSDAYHITSPSPHGEGAARCMRLAMADARLRYDEIDYINAHGTSTPHNDVNETQAVRQAFGEHAYRLAMSSTKSMTGHALGAAGAIEAAFTALALYHQVLPPTINYEVADPECDLDYVPNQARPASIRAALSNSFGFGGTNACLALRRYE